MVCHKYKYKWTWLDGVPPCYWTRQAAWTSTPDFDRRVTMVEGKSNVARLWIIIWCDESLGRYWCYLNSPGPRSKGRLCPGVFALFAETPAKRYTMMAIDHQPCYNAHNQGQDVPEALWGQVSRRTRRWSGGEGSGRRHERPWFTAPWWSLTTTPRPTIMVTKTKTKT